MILFKTDYPSAMNCQGSDHANLYTYGTSSERLKFMMVVQILRHEGSPWALSTERC